MKIIRSLPAQLKLPFSQLQLSFFREFFRIAACCLMALQLSFAPTLFAAPAKNSASTKTSPANASDPILKIMQAELPPPPSPLSKTHPPPHFLTSTFTHQ